MDKQLELLQGTLDMLILKAASLGPLHGYGILCASSKSRRIASRFNKVPSIPRCTAWSTRAGLQANGASRKTNARQNFTA